MGQVVDESRPETSRKAVHALCAVYEADGIRNVSKDWAPSAALLVSVIEGNSVCFVALDDQERCYCMLKDVTEEDAEEKVDKNKCNKGESALFMGR
jgi:hypothetical protein